MKAQNFLEMLQKQLGMKVELFEAKDTILINGYRNGRDFAVAKNPSEPEIKVAFFNLDKTLIVKKVKSFSEAFSIISKAFGMVS